MTTYILCGGTDRKYDYFGVNLAKVINNLVARPRILCCFFARPDSEWEEAFSSWIGFFEKYFPDASVELARRENFLGQVNNSDVIYFYGGRTHTLSGIIVGYDNLAEAWRGKIIIGSSAGANFLSQHFLHHKGIGGGLGILPFNIVVHYGSDDEQERRSQDDVNELLQEHPEVPTLLLREGEFTIVQGVDE